MQNSFLFWDSLIIDSNHRYKSPRIKLVSSHEGEIIKMSTQESTAKQAILDKLSHHQKPCMEGEKLEDISLSSIVR